MPKLRSTLLAALSSTSLLAQAHWTRLYPAQSPPARAYHGMAFDAAGARVLVFGGMHGSLLGDTWSFDGVTWTQHVVAGPTPRSRHAMACDTSRGVVVLFGGSPTNGSLDDTWEWSGSAWSLRTTAVRPSVRSGAAMAHDPARHVTVLFGGLGPGGGALDDTWEWNGQTWVQRNPGPSPTPRSDAALAFDPTGGGVLLFGGGASNQPAFDDTWRWNGTAWQMMQPPNPPYARFNHRMVTDTARRRVVLWGGLDWDPTVWEWDGAAWAVRTPPGPTPRAQFGMAYSPSRREVVLFSGGSTSTPYLDTWVYRTDTPAVFETIGPGCAGSAGTAQLANAPYSLPWLGDTFTTRVSSVPANGAVLFATGFEAPTPISLGLYGMPGCDLAITVAETRFDVATAGGEALWSLAIPSTTGLAGVAIAQQVLVLDPPANAAGAVLSSAGRFTLGIR